MSSSTQGTGRGGVCENCGTPSDGDCQCENSVYEVERCGYCGRFFRGTEFLTEEEVKALTPADHAKIFLGYCPDAKREHYEQNPEDILQ